MEELRQLTGYYKKHEKRMQYHTFKEKGLQIGSGAIESAHKDVLQERLKLSGQRWAKEGLQQIAQLRAAYKSGKWNHFKDLTLRGKEKPVRIFQVSLLRN